MARFAFIFVLIIGCVAADPFDPELEGVDLPLIDPGTPEALGVIAFLNDPATTFELLDIDVGLDRRAARNLIDERPFATIQEVDDVSYVGRVALAKLLAWAESGGWIPMESTRDTAILALVNDPATSFELLDVTVGLDRRAAENIIADRPFGTIAQLDAVAYVGPSALDDLADYALANGYGDAPPPPDDAPCAIISEYVESSGNNNKVVEVYNCGGGPLTLDEVGLCLVRNEDTTCSSHGIIGSGSLAAGEVWTVCRTLDGTFNDPYQPILDACDHGIGGPVIFNGDDRLVLFHDTDGSGDFDAVADTVLDQFGDPNAAPTDNPWAETNLRRCDLSPNASDVDAKFTRHYRNDWSHLDVPPSQSCAIEMRGGAGDDCTSTDGCGDGLQCRGIPNDDSSDYGKCVDGGGGSGAECDRYTACPIDEICAGWTLWGEGNCVAQWMAGRFGGTVDSPIGDAHDESVVVYGLASVPVDIEVQLRIDHPRLTDLRVTLIDPNGASAVLWDQTDELEEWSRSFVTTGGISRDDQVNGRWTLRVEDLVSGETGTLQHFQLFVVSRYD